MSKLKSVNTKNPDEFREHLESWSDMARLVGSALSADEINEMVRLHCDEGLSLDECVEKMMEKH